MQSRKRHIKEKLATLEEAETDAVEVNIRVGVFGDKESANTQADVIR